MRANKFPWSLEHFFAPKGAVAVQNGGTLGPATFGDFLFRHCVSILFSDRLQSSGTRLVQPVVRTDWRLSLVLPI